MAGNSGYVDFTATNYDSTQTLRVYWRETVSDSPGAKSTVSIEHVYLASGGYVGDTYYGDFTIQINGTDALSVGAGYVAETYLTDFNEFCEVLHSGSALTGSVSNIAHDNQGKKSVNITLKKNGISYAGFYRTGAHFSFTTSSMDRAVVLYQLPVSSLSISAATGSTITVTRGGTALTSGANLWYGQQLVIVFAASTGYQLDSHTVNGTNFNSGGTFTVPDRSVATSIAVATQASRSVSTIATANGTFCSSQPITVTRYITGATHTIVATCAGKTDTIVSNSSSLSITWDCWKNAIDNASPGQSVLDALPASMSASCVLTITTFSGGNTIGTSSITVTLALPTTGSYDVDPVPVITDSDANGYASTMGGYVAGKSALAVSIAPGLKYSASVATRSTTANGVTSGAASFAAGILTQDTSISTSVTDTRGRTGTAFKSITVQPYTSPSITTFSVHRTDSLGNADDNGGYFTATWAVSITALGGHNSKTAKIQYKKVSDSTWIDAPAITLGTYTASGTTSAIAASGDYSWDVRFILEDSFELVTKLTKLSTAAVVESRRPKGKGVAFSKVAEVDDVFDTGSWSSIGRVKGLGRARAEIPAQTGGVYTDFDDYAEPGVYGVWDSTAVATYQHCPSAYAGILTVCNTHGDDRKPTARWYTVSQVYEDINGDFYYRRGLVNPAPDVTWQPWVGFGTKSALGLGGLISEQKQAANSGSVSFTLANDEKGMLVITGSSANAKTAIVFNVNPTGSVTYKTISTASGLTVSTSTNTLTIANSSGYVAYCLKLSYIA